MGTVCVCFVGISVTFDVYALCFSVRENVCVCVYEYVPVTVCVLCVLLPRFPAEHRCAVEVQGHRSCLFGVSLE